MTDVLLLSGSTRRGSTNTAALDTCAAIASTLDPPVTAARFGGLTALPHFDPDADRDPWPPSVAELRAACDAAAAVLICTPEYAGALPGSFKNLLEWTLGAGSLHGKPVGWLNVSAGPTGAADAHASLAIVLRYAGARIVDEACRVAEVRRDAVGEDGLVHDASFRAVAASVLAALAAAAS